MYFQPYYLTCLSHASYLLGSKSTGEAVVIDPQRDIEQYVEDAKREGLTIKAVFLTHFHADFVAGHIELRERTGADIILSSKGEAEYETISAEDEQEFNYGDFSIKVLHTPGHTPESACFLAFDAEKSKTEPWAVFTGDTLFVGDVGRPDLLASIGFEADDLAKMLYNSLRTKLLTLPDETVVFPGHGAGSMCGKSLGSERSTTIGIQRAVNVALHDMSEEEFIQIVAGQPTAPQYFVHDAILNRKERPVLDDLVEKTKKLTLTELVETLKSGTLVLDARPATEFMKQHIRGAINIPLCGRFATWVGTLIGPEREFVVIATEDKVEEALTRVGRIGYDQCSAVFVVDFENKASEYEAQDGIEWASIEQIQVSDLDPVLKSIQPRFVDVRTEKEFVEASIPGSENSPLQTLESVAGEFDVEKPVLVSCRSGYRSAVACSVLSRAGVKKIIDLDGGFNAWTAAQEAVAT